MQTANIMLSLGGDTGNTVFKSNVTAAEIAVLRAIHGEDAVQDIDPQDSVERSNREELSRLNGIYGKARVEDAGGTKVPVVATLYPGAAARVHQNLSELDIPSEFYKAKERAKPEDADKDADPLDKMSKDELVAEAEKRGVEIGSNDTKAEIKKAIRDAEGTSAAFE